MAFLFSSKMFPVNSNIQGSRDGVGFCLSWNHSIEFLSSVSILCSRWAPNWITNPSREFYNSFTAERPFYQTAESTQFSSQMKINGAPSSHPLYVTFNRFNHYPVFTRELNSSNDSLNDFIFAHADRLFWLICKNVRFAKITTL